MVTEKRAAHTALLLFPDEYSDGINCRDETGREGQLCTICLDRKEQWDRRVRQVREAMIDAFS